MPADIQTQLERLGIHYERLAPPIETTEIAARRQATADRCPLVDAGTIPQSADGVMPHRARRLIALSTAATIAAGLAGFALITERHQPPTTDVGTAQQPLPSNIIGLFPSGGIDDIVAANYTSPHDVAQAYHDDRTRPDQLPTGYGARAGVTGALGEPIADTADDIADAAIRIDADTATVPFSLETRPQYDTSDGYVLTRSVPGP